MLKKISIVFAGFVLFVATAAAYAGDRNACVAKAKKRVKTDCHLDYGKNRSKYARCVKVRLHRVRKKCSRI